MPPRRDATGQRFGHLIVIKRDRTHVTPSGYQLAKWIVRCDCGKVLSVLAGQLFSGKTKSCGCKKHEFRETENIVGNRYGRLVVIERAESYIADGSKQPRWLCQCDCGNRTIVAPSNLKSGKHTSCGCIKDSKISTQLKTYLQDRYSAIPEYRVLRIPDTNAFAPYDIYIPSGIYIEIHGRHHYESDHWFHHHGKTSYRRRVWIDNLKKNFARKNGIYIEIDLRKIKTIEQAINYIEKRL